MALKKVNGIDLAQTYTPLNPRPLEWNTDTLLISEKNEIKAYRFKPVS